MCLTCKHKLESNQRPHMDIKEQVQNKFEDLLEVGDFLWDIISNPKKDPTTTEWVKMANKVDEARILLRVLKDFYFK